MDNITLVLSNTDLITIVQNSRLWPRGVFKRISEAQYSQDDDRYARGVTVVK